MNLRNRKTRIAIVLAIAVVAAFVAWRTKETPPGHKPCVEGREEEKDDSGKIIRITRTRCG